MTSTAPVWSSAPVQVPTDLAVVDDLWLRWADVKSAGDDWPGVGDLLDDFGALAAADPNGMAAFVGSYGVLELCGEHGKPDGHTIDDTGMYCAMRRDAGHTLLWVWSIQRMATGVAAARRIGRDLSNGKLGSATDWTNLQMLTRQAFRRPEYYKQGRRFFGEILTTYLRDCRVRPLVRWDESRPRPQMTVEADGLIGVIALLLRREVASGALAYQCTVCGDLVERARAPRDGESVYCDKAECRRAQQRRNQAASRARRHERETR